MRRDAVEFDRQAAVHREDGMASGNERADVPTVLARLLDVSHPQLPRVVRLVRADQLSVVVVV
jgi:hypothetical protein